MSHINRNKEYNRIRKRNIFYNNKLNSHLYLEKELILKMNELNNKTKEFYELQKKHTYMRGYIRYLERKVHRTSV